MSVAGPTVDGLPDQAIVTHLNGRAIHSRDDYRKQMGKSTETGQLTFTTSDGATHDVDDDLLPYRNIWFVDAVDDVDAAVGGHGPPYSWIRSMSMGSSHGLMVGLVTYTGVTGEDLAAGRHIAGTGQLHGDGTVGTIGGLPAKAAGARRAGADVLLVPAAQADQLDSFDPGPMRVLEVVSLQDAIDQLRDTR